jgi:hypothetical protein
MLTIGLIVGGFALGIGAYHAGKFFWGVTFRG